jgi:hypothetical protein
MRVFTAAIVAFALTVSSTAPLMADGIGATGGAGLPQGQSAQLLSLMNASCAGADAGAQEQPTAGPVESPSPAASPTPSASSSPGNGPGPGPAPRGPTQLVVPPLPTATPQFTAPPLPTPSPSPTPPGPALIQRVSPQPSGSPSPLAPAVPVTLPTGTPAPTATLGPNQYAVLADTISGTQKPHQPVDLDGNVNVIYADGIVVGDHAHYDGDRYIDVTGHPYLRNRNNDSVLHGDSIRFDTQTKRTYIVNGRGATTQGVEKGTFYFAARTLRSEQNGVTHGDRASFTTCENPRGGYHVEAKNLDITPGDKAVAHSAVLYLGALAVFWLPVVVIPLSQSPEGRREAGFIPLVGYSEVEGYFVKAQIGFAPSNTYYGYYRIDLSTKLGVGFGYVAFFNRKDGKRSVHVDFERQRSIQDGPYDTNFSLTDNENISKTLKDAFGLQYAGSYGPGITLPATFTITNSFSHTTTKDSQTLTFNSFSEGATQTSDNFGFTDQRQISPAITQSENITYSENSDADAGLAQTTSSLQLNTLTHIQTKGLSYDLTFDKTDSDDPTGINKLPELLIRPNGDLLPKFTLFPITGQFTIGDYSEEQSPIGAGLGLGAGDTVFSTQRGQAMITFGPEVAHFWGSDLNASIITTQDAYGTGDLKAQIQQNFSITTPVGNHVVNAITYNEQNTSGPLQEPFQSLDVLSDNNNQASDVVRIFNGSAYNLTLSSSTIFKREAQPVTYQLNLDPTAASSLQLGGSWVPGPGNGFTLTNALFATPVGRDMDIEFATNVEWKERGRLDDKTVFLRRVIGGCYEVRVSYNQDLKQVTFSVDLLAFPSQVANFGFQQQSSIIPGSLNFASVAGSISGGALGQ